MKAHKQPQKKIEEKKDLSEAISLSRSLAYDKNRNGFHSFARKFIQMSFELIHHVMDANSRIAYHRMLSQ